MDQMNGPPCPVDPPRARAAVWPPYAPAVRVRRPFVRPSIHHVLYVRLRDISVEARLSSFASERKKKRYRLSGGIDGTTNGPTTNGLTNGTDDWTDEWTNEWTKWTRPCHAVRPGHPQPGFRLGVRSFTATCFFLPRSTRRRRLT